VDGLEGSFYTKSGGHHGALDLNRLTVLWSLR
jgi:hypothetical protein